MKIGNKFLLAALLIASACSTAPGAPDSTDARTQFFKTTRKKIYKAHFQSYGSTQNKSWHYLTFKDDGYVLNAMVTGLEGFPWTWARLYKILHYYNSNRIAVRMENPAWDFPDWTAIEGKDQIHIIEVSDTAIFRTPFGKLDMFENYSTNKIYDWSNIEKIGDSAQPTSYPKILTIYGPIGDNTGVSEPFDPLNP